MLRLKNVIAITPFLFFLVCCKKDSVHAANIVGQWDWAYTYIEAPLYLTSTPQSSGTHQTYIFNSNHSYTFIENNVVLDSGTYTTGHNSYSNTVQTYVYDSILYKSTLRLSGGTTLDYYQINKDTLILSLDFRGITQGVKQYWAKH